MRSELITDRHLALGAVIYVRQSSPHQVLTNQESLRLQYDLRRRALGLGWREEDVEVIDADPRTERCRRQPPGGLQGFDRACHAWTGRCRAVLRGHASDTQLLGLVSAARSLRLQGLSDRRPRRCL